MQRLEATAAPEEGRGLSIMAYTGKLRPKGVPFQSSFNIIITIIPRALMGSESIAHEAERVADPGGSAGFLAAKKD